MHGVQAVRRHLFGCRYAYPRRLNLRYNSSSAGKFPYPRNPHPTPYQIFHLPSNASQADIKTRYYELVKIYHPDTADKYFNVSPELAHTRFQSIIGAYDALRGKAPLSSTTSSPNETRYPNAAAWRARQANRRDLYSGGDDRWKDGIIIAGVVITIGLFVLQTASTRRRALAEARTESRTPWPEVDKIARQQREERSLSAPDADTKR